MAEELSKNFETLQLHAGELHPAPSAKLYPNKASQVTLQTRRPIRALCPSTRPPYVHVKNFRIEEGNSD